MYFCYVFRSLRLTEDGVQLCTVIAKTLCGFIRFSAIYAPKFALLRVCVLLGHLDHSFNVNMNIIPQPFTPQIVIVEPL